MVNYQCKKCYKMFKQKVDYIRHENRKNPCIKVIEPNRTNLNQSEPTKNEQDCTQHNNQVKNKCKFCCKSFSTKGSMNRHIKGRCFDKKDKDMNLERLYMELVTEMKEQKKEIEELKKENNKLKVSNKTINNNNTQNINYITINPFGEENMENISNNVWRKIFRLNYGSIMKLIEYTHFNEQFPENSNVYISNIKSDHAMVYDGKKWNLHPKDEMINNLIDNKADCLENKFYQLIDGLDSDLKKKFQDFLDNSDDNDYTNGLKNEIKLLLYNKRDIPQSLLRDKITGFKACLPIKLIKNKDKKVICSI
jgi:hypothetical protein